MQQAADQERQQAAWLRTVRWLLIGFACSLPIHASVVMWLAATTVHIPGSTHRPAMIEMDLAALPGDVQGPRAGGANPGEVDSPGVDSAVPEPMPGEDLGPLTGGTGEGSGLAEGGAAGFGALGGVGAGSGGTGGGGGGLGGGAGSTTFFGVGGTGQRFAYIVDKSGSMSSRIEEAKAELKKSIATLPDYASIFVIFFDSGEPMSFSDRWERVRPSTLSRLSRWLRDVGPSGGTEPTPAFRRVFSLDTRPDVVFFLSDGEIPEESVVQVRQMNATGRRVTVNSIAFGEEAGSARLRRVAQDSGGEFREVQPKGTRR